MISLFDKSKKHCVTRRKNMAINMTLWIGNGAVLKSSSQWQLKEFWKLNNSVHELFIFKILLIAIDWNF